MRYEHNTQAYAHALSDADLVDKIRKIVVERDREIRVIQRQLDILGGGIDSRSISAENQRKDGSRIVSSSAAKEQYKGGCLEQLEKMVLFDKRVMATHNELVFKRMVTGTKRLLVEKRLASLRGSKGINIDEEERNSN